MRSVSPEQRGVTIGVFAAFQDLAIGATGPVLGSLTAGVFACGTVAAVVGARSAMGLHSARP